MLTISTNNSIIKTNTNRNLSYSKNSLPLTPKDNMTFTGTIIRPVKNHAETKELVNLFYDSFKHNISTHKNTSGLLEKLDRYLCTFPFLTVAKKESSVTEIVKSENKLVGGYSMNISPIYSSAHIGFITIGKEYMKTKTGIEILKTIGKRIYENAAINNVRELTWTTNSRNKQINRLLKRFEPDNVRKIASETEYKITLEKFRSKLQSLQVGF